MSTIATPSQAATSSPLKRLIRSHPLVAYFVIAYAGTWAFLLPFALSRNVNGLGLLRFTLPDIAFLLAFVLGTLAGPALASLAVTAITSGRAGVGQLLRRCVQWRVGIGWYLIAIFSFLLVFLVGYSVFLGVNLPLALLVQWPLLFTVFFPQAVFIILARKAKSFGPGVIVAGSSRGTPNMLNGILIHTIGGEQPEHLSEGAPPMVQAEET